MLASFIYIYIYIYIVFWVYTYEDYVNLLSVCIYIYSVAMFCCSLQQVDIQMRHCFSAEIDPAKRKFIVDAHVPQGEKPMFHLFKDVAAFVNGQGECATCNDQIHESSQDIDVLFAGVSCKSLSCCNTQRQKFGNCYQTGEGSSGSTYLQGFVAPVENCLPAVVFFENVRGVGQRHKTEDGEYAEAPIQVHGRHKQCRHTHTYIHKSCIYIYAHSRTYIHKTPLRLTRLWRDK